MRVLDQYVSRGVLKIYDWQISNDVTSLYMYGHNLVNMDCSYRHMGEVEHLIFMVFKHPLLFSPLIWPWLPTWR